MRSLKRNGSHSSETPKRRQSPFFSRSRRRNEVSPFFQAKLRIGEPGDRFEREADRVADEVVTRGTAPRVQAGVAPDAELRPAASGEGRPLPAEVRGEFETAFGTDLGPVRIHTGEAAATLSEGLGANAITHGRDIYFARDQFAPQSRAGRHLLAHELTHVIQQSGGGAMAGTVQADLAVEPTHPEAAGRALTPRQIADAITFNTRILTNAAEIELLRDILGLDPAPATVDDDFIEALVRYQAVNNLTQDGKLGPVTRNRLSKEILAEAEFLGFAGLGRLATGVDLRTEIRALIDAGDLTYATYRTRIRAATVLQRDVVLADVPTLEALRDHLPWNNFARCVELLGRQAPDHAFLIRQTVVRNALRAAWNASNAAVNPPLHSARGGWLGVPQLDHQ